MDLSCCVLLGHGLVKSSTAVDVGAIFISLQGEWKFLMFIHHYLRDMFAGRNTGLHDKTNQQCKKTNMTVATTTTNPFLDLVFFLRNGNP